MTRFSMRDVWSAPRRVGEVIPIEEDAKARPSAAAQREELRQQVAAMEEEIVALRQRLQDAPKRVRTLEERLLETKGQLAQAVSQNEKLTYTLREAREHIATLREEVDKLTQPPSAYGTLLVAERRRDRLMFSRVAARCGCRSTRRSAPRTSGGARRWSSTSR